ncbi:MAG: glycosyltransferase family 4 protein [Actinobacteria bacterium]|nr:glycosyltransferase family 4 protein [Actinomycetota bacterium]
MRILMLAQSYSPVVGGEERIVEDLSRELVRRGHEVVVATLAQPAGEPPRDSGVEVELLGSGLDRLPGLSGDPERRYAPPAPDPVTVRDLRRLLQRWRPDVVHGHNWLVDAYLPLDSRDGPAFVLSLHDYSLRCATKRFFYRGAVCSGPAARKCLAHAVEHYGAAKGAATALGTAVCERWLRRRVDLFLPVSEAVRELNSLGTAPSRVIPNFIGELPPSPAVAPELERLPEGPFALYFGDVTEDKGVGKLVEAYAGLEGAPPLVLVGRPLLELPAVPGVVALGRLPHPLAIEALRRSQFTVAPTLLPESFGIVALEAAAAGKPAIVSAIGGLTDVVRDGETGLLVRPGDVTALRTALRRLFADAELRQRLGEAARRRALEFSPDVVVPQFEAAYRAALDSRLKKRGGSGR